VPARVRRNLWVEGSAQQLPLSHRHHHPTDGQLSHGPAFGHLVLGQHLHRGTALDDRRRADEDCTEGIRRVRTVESE